LEAGTHIQGISRINTGTEAKGGINEKTTKRKQIIRKVTTNRGK
jgi:hypothetical protein